MKVKNKSKNHPYMEWAVKTPLMQCLEKVQLKVQNKEHLVISNHQELVRVKLEAIVQKS